MEVGELINAFAASVTQDDFCDGQKTKPTNWKSRINQWGSKGGCSGKNLYESLRKWDGKNVGYLGGPDAFVSKPAGTGYKWDLNKVDDDHFPIQAHHLIPKNFLPDQPICGFLAKKYTKLPKYQLEADTDYSNDHANNGYCMPYATPLAEWKQAGTDNDAKLIVAFSVMEQTKRQLHQGSHRERPYVEDPADPDEEQKIHPGGYLNAVKKYLNAVLTATMAHVDTCTICKPSKSKKDVQPLGATVEHVDQVSGIIKLLVDANRIFTSEPAYPLWNDESRKIKRPKWLT